jgi:hypothetical protein
MELVTTASSSCSVTTPLGDEVDRLAEQGGLQPVGDKPGDLAGEHLVMGSQQRPSAASRTHEVWLLPAVRG